VGIINMTDIINDPFDEYIRHSAPTKRESIYLISVEKDYQETV